MSELCRTYVKRPTDFNNMILLVWSFSFMVCKTMTTKIRMYRTFSEGCIIICDLLQQNPEQVAWDYFEIKVIEISRAKNWSAVQI